MLNRLKGVFKSFQNHEVKYVVIGGIASVLYGVPRATFDLDILIEASKGNAQRLLDALSEAGLETAFLTSAEGILGNEITVFKDRVRIDVQTSNSRSVFPSGVGAQSDDGISGTSVLCGLSGGFDFIQTCGGSKG